MSGEYRYATTATMRISTRLLQAALAATLCSACRHSDALELSIVSEEYGFRMPYPGKEAWFTMRVTPGRYFTVCQVPAKADGRAHCKHGMFTEFTVQ
jgi:hypothetical protein